jgi:hypothetical protein
VKLDDVIRGMGGPWTPTPEGHDYVPNFRYTGYRSCFEVEGDVMAELRSHYTETVEAHKPVIPVSWDRLLWDEPWEKPAPKPPSEKPPLLVAHVFDALEGMPEHQRVARTPQAWVLPMGMAIQRAIRASNTAGTPPFRHELVDEAFEELSEKFISSAAASQCTPNNANGMATYLFDVREVMDAASSLKDDWYNFLDSAVVNAQRGLKLKAPPVFVVLFMNFEFAPGMTEVITRALKNMSHPRLLCLFAKEP